MPNFSIILDYLSQFPTENLRKGKAFERFCKWFLENDPCYSAQLKSVWFWDEWPDNWGRDKGIDLIAETYDGKIWAIQAKAYTGENTYITKEDVDKFLSESSRTIISFRLLIATTNNLGPNAREVIKGQEKPVGLCLLEHLEASILDWSCALNDSTSPSKKEIKTPRLHQEHALDDVIAGLEQTSYGQLYMACGTGKTLVGLWLAERLKSNITLVLVPSISLVSQLYREWSNNSSESFNFYPIFVCSDKTVRKKGNDEDEQVMDVTELGFPVTTSAQDIIDELSRTPRPKVIFATYHSSPVIAQACELDSSLVFDLAIADEAHRCAGPFSSDFATIVGDKAIRTHRKLFMTATPKIFTEHVKKTTQDCDYEIVSMDDADKFGPVFHKLIFSDAIRDGLLCDYQVIISVIDNKTYQEYAERGRFVAINDHETDARTLASQIMIAKAVKEHNLARIISFHSRTKSARTFIDSLPKALTFLNENERPAINFTDIISGDMPQDVRSRILKRFKQTTQGNAGLLANVRCLSEGVDVPTLDAIAFIDPKGSEIDIVQAVGRVIRKSSDKKLGTILIPVFIDDITDDVVALEQSCFKTVWRVVRALRAHDDALAEELDTIRLELGKRAYKSPPKLGKITIDVPIGIGIEFGESLKIKLLENIVEHCSSDWNYYFGLLKEFREIFPNRWPNKRVLEEKNLAHWCGRQRQLFKKNQLNSKKLTLLDDIDFIWDCLSDLWCKQLDFLKKFREKYPDRWPTKYEEFPAGNPLGGWCSQQRKYFIKQKLEKWRIDELNNIGFCWDIFIDEWNKQFNFLKSFKELHPMRWPFAREEFPRGNRLGVWCGTQRQNKKNGLLDGWKIKLLNDLQFIWDPIHDEWLNQYNILKEYRVSHPNEWPMQKSRSVKSGLGVWCTNQRQNFRKGLLDKIKIDLLNQIGFPWTPAIDDFNMEWDNQFANLKAFRKIYCDRWPKHREEFPAMNKLGRWCARQREANKRDQLSSERKDKLNAIGFLRHI